MSSKSHRDMWDSIGAIVECCKPVAYLDFPEVLKVQGTLEREEDTFVSNVMVGEGAYVKVGRGCRLVNVYIGASASLIVEDDSIVLDAEIQDGAVVSIRKQSCVISTQLDGKLELYETEIVFSQLLRVLPEYLAPPISSWHGTTLRNVRICCATVCTGTVELGDGSCVHAASIIGNWKIGDNATIGAGFIHNRAAMAKRARDQAMTGGLAAVKTLLGRSLAIVSVRSDGGITELGDNALIRASLQTVSSDPVHIGTNFLASPNPAINDSSASITLGGDTVWVGDDVTIVAVNTSKYISHEQDARKYRLGNRRKGQQRSHLIIRSGSVGAYGVDSCDGSSVTTIPGRKFFI